MAIDMGGSIIVGILLTLSWCMHSNIHKSCLCCYGALNYACDFAFLSVDCNMQ